ncbi:PQQ-binding-like beta-propeller repeat protein [bacterium]|nr:PQQ-binding-like beta-propeller repeat protein [bacterium]
MKRIIAVLFLIGSTSLIYAQWPQWRGPARDGFSAESGLLKTWPSEGPALLWSSDTIGNGYASAIVQDGMVYVTGAEDSSTIMSAFRLDGQLRWRSVIGKARVEENMAECSTPTWYKGRLYTVTSAGDLCCIDAGTGVLKWKFHVPDRFGSTDYFCESPLVADDRVIVTPCGKNTTVAAVNSGNGETLWMSESIADTNVYVSPVLIGSGNRKLIVTVTQHHVVAVDFNTGEIVWKQEDKMGYVPLPAGRQVYFPGSQSGGKMLDISWDGRFRFNWSDSLKMKILGGPVKLGNRIYGTVERGSGLCCLDWINGKQLSVLKGIRGANLLAADGMIYSYEDKNGRVSLLKPDGDHVDIAGSFKVTHGQGPNLAHMAIGHGILFVRHGNALMAYDIKQR